MDDNYFSSHPSPVGTLYVAQSGGFITNISYRPVPGFVQKETELIARAIGQLCQYFDGIRKSFDLPLLPGGTAFQNEAWAVLLAIPYGQTRTYKEQAAIMNRVSGFQAVGGANSKNPISIVIPCHRVIGSNGSLIGYSGGTEAKRFLLELEASNSNNTAQN